MFRAMNYSMWTIIKLSPVAESRIQYFCCMDHGQRKRVIKQLVFDALSRLMQGNDRADLILNNLFRVNRVSDEIVRRETAKIFYGLIRFWRPITSAVRMGEVLFPADAERLIEAFEIWSAVYRGHEVHGNQGLADKFRKYMRVRKIRESVSDWMDETGVKEMGEEKWEQVVHFMNTDPKVFLRANSSRITSEELAVRLAKTTAMCESVPGLPDALVLAKYANVFSCEEFADGLFEVQDRSSQEVGLFCNVKPGMIVIDACAGTGGKTLQLASIMKNSGKIYAMDNIPGKLKTLRDRCTKAKTDIVEAVELNENQTPEAFNAKADLVLLDVPCSGSGVLRRNPDAKWRMEEEDLVRMREIQRHILESYSKMVKPGGRLVYSTCSVFPSEGEMQSKWFSDLKKEEWTFETEKRIGADENSGDGFYMASWTRK